MLMLTPLVWEMHFENLAVVYFHTILWNLQIVCVCMYVSIYLSSIYLSSIIFLNELWFNIIIPVLTYSKRDHKSRMYYQNNFLDWPPLRQGIFSEWDWQSHNDNFIRNEIILTAGRVLQAEKGYHTQLALWNYGEKSQVNSCIMISGFVLFFFPLVVQKMYDWRDCTQDVNKKQECRECEGLQ